MIEQSRSLQKRILLLTTSFAPLIGGSEIAIQEVTKRLPDTKFDIVTPKHIKSEEDILLPKNVDIFRVGAPGSAKWLFPLTGLSVVRKLTKQHTYDAVHVWQASYAGGLAWNIGWFSDILVIVTLQEGKDLGSQNFFIKLSRSLILKRTQHITAISNYLAGYARTANPKATVTRIPNGVDSRLFGKHKDFSQIDRIKKELNINESDIVLITISRLVRKNGVDTIFDALAKLPGNNFKLLVAGTGDEEPILRDLARKLHVTDAVKFLGDVSYNALPSYLAFADIFVRPSRSEGLGNAFLEAMAAGVPAIGTAVGGIPDFLDHEKTGLIVPVDDSQELANSVLRIQKDPSLANRLRENALRLVRDEYNWDFIAKQYQDVYDQIAP